jgi:hypothetical protein
MSKHASVDRSAPDTKGRSPRERVMAHLEWLLRGAAAVGTGALLAWGSRADAQQPPSGDTTSDVHLDGFFTPTTPQVCDPLPPPVNCTRPGTVSLRWCVAQRARWVPTVRGWAVDLTMWTLQTPVSPYGRSLPSLTTPPPPRILAPGESAPSVSFGGVARADVTVEGATVESLTSAINRIDLTLVPAKTATTVVVTLPTPSNTRDRFTVELDVNRPKNEPVPVKLAGD